MVLKLLFQTDVLISKTNPTRQYFFLSNDDGDVERGKYSGTGLAGQLEKKLEK